MVTGIGKAGKKPTGVLLSFIAFHAFMAGKLKVTLLLLSLLLLIFILFFPVNKLVLQFILISNILFSLTVHLQHACLA